jgi:hypothetical protein
MADISISKSFSKQPSKIIVRTPEPVGSKQVVSRKLRPVPFWLGGRTQLSLFDVDTTGTISGTVSMPSGTSPTLARVTLISKSTLKAVSAVHPNAAGTFTFTGVDRTSQNEYMAICEVPGSFNAVIYDKLVIA